MPKISIFFDQLIDLIEYFDNYSKTSLSLRQYYKDGPNDNIATLNHLNIKQK